MMYSVPAFRVMPVKVMLSSVLSPQVTSLPFGLHAPLSKIASTEYGNVVLLLTAVMLYACVTLGVKLYHTTLVGELSQVLPPRSLSKVPASTYGKETALTSAATSHISP